MTAPLSIVGAVLLSVLAVPVALRARGSPARRRGRMSSRGRGWSAPEGGWSPRSRGRSRWRMWLVGRGSSSGIGSSWGMGLLWSRGPFSGRRSRRRAHRSASLGRRPFDGRSAGPTAAPDRSRPNPAGSAGPGPRPPVSPSPAHPPGLLGPSNPPAPPGRPLAHGRDRPWARIGRELARLPRPGRAAALRRELEEAVPEVVDVLRATVGAGINPRRALQAAAEGAPSALEDVLGRAIRAAELGSGAGAALAAAARAERLSELALAGEALDLAETTGAPPGPVLAGVATAAADRVRSRQARMAATAEARLSARVVAAMAPAFLGVLALTSPSDAAFLVREPLGWATLAAAAVLELLGICWATRIVRGPTP
jgi:Type II secretion system (T2SS), protein F